jgi:hypothetical protein
VAFEPNESLYAVAICEARNESVAVLPDALHQIVGHPDIKGTVSLGRKNVDKESHARGSWTPAFAGVSGDEIPLQP